MTKTDQLERQSEQTRNQLSATLNELRERLRPASLGRETLKVARRSEAARFVTNLGTDARNNAVPLAGLAASIAWVMLNKGRRPGAAPSSGSYGRVREAVGLVFDSATSVASGVMRTAAAGRSAAQGAARSVSQTATSAAWGVSEGSSAAMASTRSAGDRIQQRLASAARTTRRGGRAVRDGVSSARRQAALSAGGVYTLTRNDPVFAAGIGLAMVGLAAAVFGWSRNPVNSRAAGDLTDAARGGRRKRSELKLSPVPENESPIVPGAVAAPRIYGDDHTGGEVNVEKSIAQ